VFLEEVVHIAYSLIYSFRTTDQVLLFLFPYPRARRNPEKIMKIMNFIALEEKIVGLEVGKKADLVVANSCGVRATP
jgi:hypothetical protein